MQAQTSKVLDSAVAGSPLPGRSAIESRSEAQPIRSPWLLLGLGSLLSLILLLYWSVAVKLVTDWYELPDFSHGFLIPFFLGYLIWMRRDKLRQIPIEPSWYGAPLVLLGLLVLLTGRFGADLFLSRISFLILAAGCLWLCCGRQMLLEFRFLLLVALLAIPLPAVVFNQVTFPLQLFASRLAGAMLPLAGVPVLREGNVIQLPAMQLEVAEACSGIRSLLSLLTLALIYGYFLEKSTGRRVLLVVASIPIAVAANVARIFGTGLCVQYWDPDKAMGFFHEFSGWLMFLVSLFLLYLVHQLTGLVWRRRGKAALA